MKLLRAFHVGMRCLKPSPQACSTRHLGEPSSLASHDLIFLFFIVLFLQKYRNKCSLSFSIIALYVKWQLVSVRRPRLWTGLCQQLYYFGEKSLKDTPHPCWPINYESWTLLLIYFDILWSTIKFSSKRLTTYWSSMCWNWPQIYHLHRHHHDYHHHYIIIPSLPPPY